MLHRMLFSLLLLFALSACRSTEESEAEAASRTPSSLEQTASAPIQAEIETVRPDEIPAFGRLTFDPEVAEPGAEVQVRFEALKSGTLHVAVPGAEAVVEVPLREGEARLVIPEQATAGMAFAYVVDEKGSLATGSFRVVTEPGLWLVMERTMAGPGEVLRMRAYAYGLPQGLYAFIEFIPPAPDETRAEEGPTVPINPSAGPESTLHLVPDAEGMLVPGTFFGVPLEEFLGRDLYLRGGDTGQYRLTAADTAEYQQALAEAGNDLEALSELDEPDVEEFTSTAIALEICTRSGVLEGHLGGPAWVSVFPFGPQGRPRSLHTEDGRFRLDVAPGTVFVMVHPDDGTQPQSQFVGVPCGGTATLTAFRGAPLPAIPASGLTEVGYALGTQPGTPFELAQQAGDNQAICKKAVVFQVEMSTKDPEEDQQRFGNPIEQALTAHLQQTLPRLQVANSIFVNELLRKAAEVQLRGEGCEGDVCAIVVKYLDADYIVTMAVSEFQVDQGSIYVAYLVGINVHNAQVVVRKQIRTSSLESLTNPSMYRAFAEALAEAGLCGDLEVSPPATWNDVALMTLPPAQDAEREFHIRVTNLAGKGVPADLEVKPEPTCGELDPSLPTEIDDSGELTLTFKGKGTEESCVETLEFEATRRDAPSAPLRAIPPKDTMPMYVAVGPLLQIGMGAVQAEQFRTGALTPLGAVTVAESDERELEVLGGIVTLDLKGECQMMAPLSLLERGEEHRVVSTQPGHEARSSMRLEVDPETGVTRLILEAEAKATPPNPSQRQPIYYADAILGEPVDLLMFYGVLPTLYVIDVQVPPELQGMPARMRMVWTVEGETEGIAGWYFAAYSALLECDPNNPNNPALVQWPQGFVHYRLLLEADERAARDEWFFSTSSLPERLQVAIWASGRASAVSEVYRDLDRGLIPYSGRAFMRVQMEVQLLPDLPQSDTSQ